jgi:hypothetical protein
MFGFFRTLHDMFCRVHNMYPHTIICFVSCTLDLCSPYVATSLRNDKQQICSKKYKFFQKIQKFPKKLKFSKKAKIWIILDFLANLAFMAFFWLFFLIFGLFGQFLHFWPFFFFFWLFGHFWILCSLHRGTYRVQQSDVDDSLEGTEKAL